MTFTPRTLSLVAMAAVLMSLTIYGCSKKEPVKAAHSEAAHSDTAAKPDAHSSEGESKTAGAITLSETDIRTAGIAVEPIQEQAASEEITLTATIQANQDRIAHVAPRVAGRIVKVNVALGDKVKEGQALALLDSIELGEAHSAFRQAQSEATLAEANFKRAVQLNEEQIIAQKDYLQARYEREKAQASMRAAREKLRLLGVRADAEPAAEGGSVFPLIAPFAGSIIEKHAILGELADPSESMFTVADLSTVWIEASVFEKDLGKIRVGAPAVVRVNAYPQATFKGRVAYLGSTMDKETRTVKARIEAANEDGRLKPEMFASAAIAVDGTTRQALAVPEAAIVLVQGLPTVFVQTSEGFVPRAVETDASVGGRTVVKSGITAGERIVMSGAYALKARMLKSQIGDEH
jgi:cobalt-zinc-cadmium efflux system membrane fusion protein